MARRSILFIDPPTWRNILSYVYDSNKYELEIERNKILNTKLKRTYTQLAESDGIQDEWETRYIDQRYRVFICEERIEYQERQIKRLKHKLKVAHNLIENMIANQPYEDSDNECVEHIDLTNE
jgi:hypothetical protein